MKKLKKVTGYSKNMVSHAKKKVTRELKQVISKRVMTKPEARSFLKAVLGELRAESVRIASFAKQEFSRESKKLKPVLKKAARRMTQ